MLILYYNYIITFLIMQVSEKIISQILISTHTFGIRIYSGTEQALKEKSLCPDAEHNDLSYLDSYHFIRFFSSPPVDVYA